MDYKPPTDLQTARPDIIYSEKIESTLLKAFGKKLLSYDTLVFFLNKILTLCMIIVFFNRPDFATVKF